MVESKVEADVGQRPLVLGTDTSGLAEELYGGRWARMSSSPTIMS